MPKKSLRKSPASIVKTAMEPTISRMEVTVKIIGIEQNAGKTNQNWTLIIYSEYVKRI